jgi:hypothetical protein
VSAGETHGRRDNVLTDRLRLNGLAEPPPMSGRHRAYGRNVPAVDLDLLLVEYDMARPVAIIDFKYGLDRDVNLAHPSLRALGQLHGADGRSLPTFVCKYREAQPQWWFALHAVNERANRVLEWADVEEGQLLSERFLVTLLYAMRGRPLPANWQVPA